MRWAGSKSVWTTISERGYEIWQTNAPQAPALTRPACSASAACRNPSAPSTCWRTSPSLSSAAVSSRSSGPPGRANPRSCAAPPSLSMPKAAISSMTGSTPSRMGSTPTSRSSTASARASAWCSRTSSSSRTTRSCATSPRPRSSTARTSLSLPALRRTAAARRHRPRPVYAPRDPVL